MSEKVSITWASSPDSFYTLQSSIDMRSWQEIDDGIESQGELTVHDHLISDDKSKNRFYRVVKE